MATMPLALMALIWPALVLSMSTSSIFWAPVALSRMLTSTDPSICQFHEVPGRSGSMPVGGASVVVVVVVGVVDGSVDVVVGAGVVVVLCSCSVVVVVLQRWRPLHPTWCDAAPAAWAAAAVNVTSSSTKAALRILRMSGLGPLVWLPRDIGVTRCRLHRRRPSTVLALVSSTSCPDAGSPQRLHRYRSRRHAREVEPTDVGERLAIRRHDPAQG